MMFPVTRRVLTPMRVMRAGCLLIPDSAPKVEREPCIDPDCKTTTDTHNADCGVDMGADSMHERFLAGARVGVF